jgi:hypothetical protein
MSNEGVSATFAGMLSELEDVATRLTVRHAELARQLADVEAELRKVEKVRAAMADKSPARTVRSGSGTKKDREHAKARVATVIRYAKANGGSFTAAQAAEAIGTEPRGVGPILAGMVRRGEVTVREDADGRRIYSVPA